MIWSLMQNLLPLNHLCKPENRNQSLGLNQENVSNTWIFVEQFTKFRYSDNAHEFSSIFLVEQRFLLRLFSDCRRTGWSKVFLIFAIDWSFLPKEFDVEYTECKNSKPKQLSPFDIPLASIKFTCEIENRENYHFWVS